MESSIVMMWDEGLDREIFHALAAAQALIQRWRREDDTIRPRYALGASLAARVPA